MSEGLQAIICGAGISGARPMSADVKMFYPDTLGMLEVQTVAAL